MPKLEDLIKSDLTKGLAIGVGLAAVAPVVIPAVVQAARPLLRSAVKSGILLLEMSREVVAEASENLEDIVAEVRSELAERHQAGATETTTEPVATAESSAAAD